MLFLLLVGVIAACTNRRDSRTPESGATVLRSSAPQGMSLNDLGRPFDASFQRLQGPDGANLFKDAKLLPPTPQNSMQHEFVLVEDTQTFAANAGAWGFEGEHSTAREDRFASYRAMIIRKVHEIDDTTAMRKAPAAAVYYPARVYYGHIYEVLVTGTKDTFNAGVAARLVIVEGNVDDFARQHQLELQANGRGLTPTNGKAIFARTQDAINKAYKADDADAVPILVEWRVIPGRNAPNRPIQWKALKQGCKGEPGCAPCTQWSFSSISYAAPGTKRSGHGWDADGSPPDLTLSIRVSGSRRGTSKRQDVQSATWRLDPPLVADAGAPIAVTATDADLMENDRIDDASERVPDTLPGGTFTFGAGSVTLKGVCAE